jgi:hypothetical protein
MMVTGFESGQRPTFSGWRWPFSLLRLLAVLAFTILFLLVSAFRF